MKFLIVGLGNIGAEYAHTRHNIGFDVVEALAAKHGASFRVDRLASVAEVKLKGKTLIVIEPSTFMNRSGQAVAALCRFHKINPDSMLIVHDELDLKPGVARLKWAGGLGGHNGLKDISAHLDTNDYWRLRLGIGHPRDSEEGKRNLDVADYVLKKPRLEEQIDIDRAMSCFLKVMPLIAKNDMNAATMELHSNT